MKNILIIIQRSNGDVFMATALIQALKNTYQNVNIDMLVNDDTLATAKTIPNVRNILLYSYAWRKQGIVYRLKQEYALAKSIYKKYHIAINLTTSDRSVLLAILAGKKSVSAIEYDAKKSWWKKKYLDFSYTFDNQRSIFVNNIEPLKLFNIKTRELRPTAHYTQKGADEVEELLQVDNIKDFIIFHPSAQYDYKVYPKHLRDELLGLLNTLNIPIVITGGKSEIDSKISSEIPELKNVYNYIGKTSLEGYIALCDKSMCYIGMDTLNMHVAAALNKRVFAIFGPTKLSMWSPWENNLNRNTLVNAPLQTYGKITIFQADMDCVACGLAGCDDKHGQSVCLSNIEPNAIFEEVIKWSKSQSQF